MPAIAHHIPVDLIEHVCYHGRATWERLRRQESL